VNDSNHSNQPKLEIVPIYRKEALAYIRRHHRHHLPPQGYRVAMAVRRLDLDSICGVATLGRPVARHLDDGWTAEVTRVATDGTPNACSCLYGACWRAARALGYRRLITYTLHSESGASLRASGYRVVDECAGGGSWSRGSRPRVDNHPTQLKIRWQRGEDTDG